MPSNVPSVELVELQVAIAEVRKQAAALAHRHPDFVKGANVHAWQNGFYRLRESQMWFQQLKG